MCRIFLASRFQFVKNWSNLFKMLLCPVCIMLLCVLPNSCAVSAICTDRDDTQWAPTGLGCLHYYAYKNAHLTDSSTLVVVLHGDAPFVRPGYQYKLAKRIAEENSNTLAVGLLRPGYTDDDQHRSDGVRGHATGDNYTPEVLLGIEEAILFLQLRYHPAKTLLLGHSGGAAIAADLIGIYPNLVQGAALVSCPCDLETWRKHMQWRQFYNPLWSFPVRSISPKDVISSVNKSQKVLVFCGLQDDITPPRLSREYAQMLSRQSPATNLVLAPGGHEIFNDDSLFVEIRKMIQWK